MEPTKKHLAVLKKYFGHKEFRPMQWKIISSIINDHRDNCVVMATGSGKSLCFQYPPVFCNGTALVISPLISLMQDQVMALKMSNIPATFLGTAQSSKDTINRLIDGEFNVVYVTPEWCSGENGINTLQKLADSNINITLVAIDEAHCVSQWGMDFRTSYRKLGNLKKYLPHVPFLTVTATATDPVRLDICSSLNLRNPLISRSSCDRPNLYLSASIKGKDPSDDIKSILERDARIYDLNAGNSSCIIYCPTKKVANKIADHLNDSVTKCSLYHGDLSLKVRENVHKDFVRDKINVIVATVAFGMGIDKPDVRRIIHYGAPKDIETYYQEIGRAGRDGLPALCHVFYAQADFNLAKIFFSSLSGKFKEYKDKMSKLMENYLQTSECRRQLIVSHFDPDCQLEEQIRCCDNCTKKKMPSINNELNFDLTEDVLLMLKVFQELQGKYGLVIAIYLLRGSTNKRLNKKYYSSDLYGAGRFRPEEWWKLLGGLLIREDLIEEQLCNNGGWNKSNFPVSTLKLSEKGRTYLLDNNWRKRVTLSPTQEMLPHIRRFLPKKNMSGSWISSGILEEKAETNFPGMRQPCLEEIIFTSLMEFRTKVAVELGCMPYMVFNNRTIQYLAQRRPTTIEELSSVEGITEKNVETFGQACIDTIFSLIEKYKIQNNKQEGGRKDLKMFVHNRKQRILRYENKEEDGETSKINENNEESNANQMNQNSSCNDSYVSLSPKMMSSGVSTGSDETFFSTFAALSEEESSTFPEKKSFTEKHVDKNDITIRNVETDEDDAYNDDEPAAKRRAIESDLHRILSENAIQSQSSSDFTEKFYSEIASPPILEMSPSSKDDFFSEDDELFNGINEDDLNKKVPDAGRNSPKEERKPQQRTNDSKSAIKSSNTHSMYISSVSTPSQISKTTELKLISNNEKKKNIMKKQIKL